jgi:hypothetical protein
MQELLIVLKTGHKFTIEVKSIQEFYKGIGDNVNSDALHNIHVEGEIWVSISEVSAMHPKWMTSND